MTWEQIHREYKYLIELLERLIKERLGEKK